MKHIKINSVGEVIGMYLDEPEESQIAPGESSVALSDEDWQSVGPGYRYISGKLAPPAPVVIDPRAALKTAVTAKRWAVEAGGITLPNGVQVSTGTADQNRIASVIATAALGGVESIEFKASSGWTTLTLEQLRGIAAAIALHVQACFAAERKHHEAIDAASDAALASYDVDAGWREWK